MDQPDPDMPMGARRRADTMVGLFVAAVVALLAAVTVFATDGSGALAAGLAVAAVVAVVVGVVLARTISPEDRARLTAPKEDGSA